MKHTNKLWGLFFGWILILCFPLAVSADENNDLFPPTTIVSNPSICDLNILIPDQSCFIGGITVEIEVDNLPGISLGNDILLKEVRMVIEHDWLADLEVNLRSPNGVVVTLTADNGSSNDNYGNPTNGLCDEYTSFINNGFAGCNAIPIDSGTPPFIGDFLPEGDFSAFNDGSNPDAGNWILELCDDGGSHEGTLEFVELVFVSQNCAAPSNVLTNSVDSISADISWTSGNLGVVGLIEYGLSGFNVGTGQQITATTNPFTLTNLSPEEHYDFYISEACGAGNFSQNSCVSSFTTTCSPPPITLIENFDTEDGCFGFCGFPCQLNGFWQNIDNDNFDWIADANGTASSFTGPPADISGTGKYLYIETTGGGCQNGNQAILLSELMDIHANGSGCDMSFNYHARGANIGSLALEITEDCGNNWQNLFFLNNSQGDDWQFTYIDLSAFDGKTVQFRFLGTGGNGYAGDIALDEITFYGSTSATNGINVYYLDQDQDGFGLDNQTIFSCDLIPPFGYVAIGGDCNDDQPLINPNMPEIPCDGIDNNCNGFFDDLFLFSPNIEHEEICVGQIPVLKAIPQSSGGFIEWFENESDFFSVSNGSNYSPPGIENMTVVIPTTLTFWARERNGFLCFSDKIPVTLTIYPNPNLEVQEVDPLCSGIPLNLLDFVNDNNNTNSTQICYNQNNTPLANCIVFPNAINHIYRVVFLAEGNCESEVTFNINVLPSPEANIEGDDTVCKGNSSFLTVTDIGNGLTPLTFQWNTGSNSNFTQVFSNQNASTIDNYAVIMTAANGCTSSDFLNIETVETISSVAFQVNDVTICNGENGSIELNITGGNLPYNVQWFGEEFGFFKTYSTDTIINNLKQGYYQIQITDDDGNGCSTTLPQMVVNGPAATIDNVQITAPSCSDSSDGCIDIEVNGSNPIIIWSNGEQTETICDLEAGNYFVTVFDGSCTNELTVSITAPTDIVASLLPSDVSCNTGSDGEIETFASGGTGALSFLWNTGTTTQNIENLPANSYQVTITDTNNCSNVFETQIGEPSPMSLLGKTISGINCHNEETAFISIKPDGGVSPYQIIWSNGNTNFINQNLEAGIYFATIIDANGCEFIDTSEILDIPPLSISYNFSDPTCVGLSDGTIDISVFGGVPPYSYLWNNGAISEDLINNLAPGIYWVEITDANGCKLNSDTITLIGKEILVYETEVSNPKCSGVNDGFINLNFHDSILVSNLNFIWSNDSTSQNISNLPAGEYSVTITDSDNCQVDSTIQLVAPISMNLTVSVVHSSCYEEDNGSITVAVNGDNPSYSILWNTGEVSFTISDLAPGFYSATVTDAIFCEEYIDSIEIVEFPEIIILEESLEHIICNGAPLGSIDISVSGGAGDFEFQWSNGAATEDINEIYAGEFLVTITDANNCIKVSKSFLIEESEPIQVSTNFIGEPGCEGGSIETLCAFAIGGSPPYSFEWNNGLTSACLDLPPTGDYEITITDNLGCIAILSEIKVADPVTPLNFIYPDGDTIQTLCTGGGSVLYPIEIIGGSMPYQYLWSHGDGDVLENDTLWVSDLEPGICNVTITDNFGCVLVSDSIKVVNVEPVFLNFEKENIRCNGGSDGQILIFTGGGTPTYDYYWFDISGDTILIDNMNLGIIDDLEAGIYSVDVFDTNGCQAGINDIEIIEPAMPLSMIPIEITPPQCFGEDSGQITLTPSGGIPPFDFLWSNGEVTQNLSDIQAGFYEVTMTDANLCPLIQGLIVEGPSDSLHISASNIEHNLCAGDETGSIDLTVTGGWGNYNYFWTPPVSTSQNIEDQPAGQYSVLISDEMGCMISSSHFEITEPDSIFIDVQKDDTTVGMATGFIQIEVSGGIEGYTYEWNTGDSGTSLENLTAGVYSVTVTDAVGCTSVRFIQINGASGIINSEFLSLLSVFPNPAYNQVNLEIALKNPLDLEIVILDIIGKKQLQFKMNNFHKGQFPLDISKLSAGTYLLLLKNEGLELGQEKLIIID